jgi:low affinity Fe/Cu permease
VNRWFDNVTRKVATTLGHAPVFVAAVVIITAWAALGPVFKFSDTWQLFINTGTTIVTFLMVFIIQNTQNRDNMAINAKLDELLRESDAQNKYLGLEDKSEEEINEAKQK